MDKRVVVTFVVTLILFGFVNFVFINFFGTPFSFVSITGNAIVNDSAIVQVVIEEYLDVYIYSPENITYNFNKGDPYIISLNVSAGFPVEPNGWKYSLYDLTHEVFVEEDTPFTPNSSINAVRWGNLLTVYALSDSGQWGEAEVVFYVEVPNSDPLIGNISDPLYVCEGKAINYEINATDIDEDNLIGSISPKNPFYLSFDRREDTISFFNIISGRLDKEDVGYHLETISVVDPWGGVDSKAVGIDVIEINNLPFLENIGAQTVWLTGENSTFYHVVDVIDVEDGDAGDGNLNFNLTWLGGEDLFDIGVSDGVMNYTPIVGQEGRVYSLQLCVEDNPLIFVHDNISLCFPNGYESNVVCDSFTLTVTDENRAPEILDYSPINSTFSVPGMSTIGYNVSVYDPDGTIPDIDWYVDNVLIEHNENVSQDVFSYAFRCGVGGAHSVKIVTSDGLLNDSFTWSINVNSVQCPAPPEGGGGGGGSTYKDFCSENWLCDDWDVCQNVKRSFDSGILSLEDYSLAKDACFQNKEEDDRFCGFQIRVCHDLNGCDNDKFIFSKPSERRFCYFTENPSCSDGITNCHDGACEVLADCGGPCADCPTCSDGVQNQGEAGIDCGGPCPYLCEPEVPFAMISTVLIVVSIVLVLVILFVLWRLFLLWRRKDKEEKNNG